MNSLLARNVSKEYFSSGRVFYSFSKVGTVLVLEPSALGTPFFAGLPQGRVTLP